VEQKKCKQCEQSFEVSDGDQTFLEKISPNFGDTSYKIPSPTLCRDCRSRRRLSWRNERSLYKRNCDLCNKEVVTLYHKDSPFKVYCQECFWSDKWDSRSYGQDFDPNKSFFEQFKELQAKTPRIALLNSRSENSEYANHATRNKDCYLVFASFDNENVMFSWRTRDSKEVLEAYACSKGCELCYEGYRLENCNKTNYSANCQNCSDSNFLSDCASCKNCYMCVNMRNKQYCFLNEQLTKEEYENKIPDLGSRKIVDEEKKKFSEFLRNQPRPYAHIVNSEDCLGDDLIHCAKCNFCFDIEIAEDCKNFDNGENLHDCQDVYGGGYPAEWMYEVHGVLDGHYVAFSHASYYSTRVYYADKCYNCQDIFGCVSLKKNQYCILNKQYTKEEYEKKVADIIAKMTEQGEWGEFFPTSLSPFAYNETMALERFPLSKEEASKIGARWLEGDYTPKYDGETYEPKDNIKDYENEDERGKLLSGIIKCSASGMPYKILPQELAFYIKNNIPIPTKHYSQRYKERMNEYSPKRKLYHRSCMNEGPSFASTFAKATVDKKATDGRCTNEFETTYAPDRPEKVYCETCYQGIIK